jgi:hypothetical protein
VVLLGTDDVSADLIADLGRGVVAAIGDRRPTLPYWNLHADASLWTMAWRFASAADREAVVEGVALAAQAASMRLTPDELASTPARFRRSGGTSQFRPKHSAAGWCQPWRRPSRSVDRHRRVWAGR